MKLSGWALAAAVVAVAAGCTSGATPQPSGSRRPGPGFGIPAATGPAANWPTYDRTSGRSGVSITSPAAGQVRQSWSAAVDGAVYAQPLIVNGEVIVATENNSVYALGETSGAVRWSRHLASPVTGGLPCGNVGPSGITGTPVVDVAAGKVWVVTFSARPSYRHLLWEIDAVTGRIVAHRPIDARGSDPRAQQQRGALVISGSRVYVPFGGLFGDCSDYKGRVVAAPISGRGPLISFSTTARRHAGIWAPAGESVRAASLYVATGNGSPASQIGESDSVLRLSQRLKVLGRFTPGDFRSLSAHDWDLGSTAPALLPGGLIFQIGKEGVGYVLDGTRLGGTGGQPPSSHLCDGGFGGDAVDGRRVVLSCFRGLYAIDVIAGKHGARPRIRAQWSATGTSLGPPIIAGGVVWVESRAGTTLAGYRLSDGRRVFAARTAPVVTDFPSPAASGSRLVVPEGSTVVCYVGV